MMTDNALNSNEKMVVTIQDIAEEVGVSRGTVDRVLNHRGRVSKETEQRVLEVAGRLGYQKSMAGTALAARRKKLQLGFIYIDSPAAAFHRQIYEAAVRKGRELAQYGVTVHSFGLRYFTETELERARKFIVDHPDISGYAIYGSFAGFLRRTREENGMPEVPIVTYNIDIENPDERLCFVGCDYLESGRIACGLTAIINSCAKVLIVSEDPGDIPSGKQRLEGFAREKERYPQMQIAGTIYLQNPVFMDRDQLRRKVRHKLLQDPDIDAVYLMNPSDYSLCDVIHEAAGDRKMTVITNDLVTAEQMQMLRDGRITATITQEPEKQGKKPLEILFRYLTMDRKPEHDWIKTRLSITIRQNLENES